MGGCCKGRKTSVNASRTKGCANCHRLGRQQGTAHREDNDCSPPCHDLSCSGVPVMEWNGRSSLCHSLGFGVFFSSTCTVRYPDAGLGAAAVEPVTNPRGAGGGPLLTVTGKLGSLGGRGWPATIMLLSWEESQRCGSALCRAPYPPNAG